MPCNSSKSTARNDFQDDLGDKPVSIIITTLAAKAYDNEANLYDALFGIVQEMPKHIERAPGWPKTVANPVNVKENFADKWKSHPENVPEKFFTWLQTVEDDFTAALSTQGIHKLVDLLGVRFGKATMNKAPPAVMGKGLRGTAAIRPLDDGRRNGGARLAPGGIKVKEHTFFGEMDET